MLEFDLQFTLFLLTNGVMIGLMYALIALGFVLIYKATDAINFAQGEFVMFAGFIAAGTAVLAFGAGTRNIAIPIPDNPIPLGSVTLPPVEVVGALVSLVFLGGFTWFFL